MSHHDSSLKEDLSNLIRFPLTDRHVSVIVENADRKGISPEDSAMEFLHAIIDYESRRTPIPRTN